MKLILILKEICYRLNLIADYVVEQGTVKTSSTGVSSTGATTWWYKKYNSGFAEMVGYRDTNIAVSEWVAWGSDYYSQFGGTAIPITLTTLISSEGYIYDKTAGYMLGQLSASAAGSIATTTYTGYFAVNRSTKPTSAMSSVRMVYRVYGLWK